jgi:hypothetical protein
MRFVLNKHVVCVVLIAFACHILPASVFAGDTLVAGKSTAGEAAAPDARDSTPSDSTLPLRYAIPMTGGYAQPDSTEYEFPEEKKSHLARDITIFVIVSAFVGYFLVKVFLEGDKEDQGGDEGGNGKPPPPI